MTPDATEAMTLAMDWLEKAVGIDHLLYKLVARLHKLPEKEQRALLQKIFETNRELGGDSTCDKPVEFTDVAKHMRRAKFYHP